MLQHAWTYKPLVHDVLGMHANSVTIDTKAEAGQLPGTTSKKRYEVCTLSDLLCEIWTCHSSTAALNNC